MEGVGAPAQQPRTGLPLTPEHDLDCVYIAASAQDGRFTRTCIASVRYFYPEIPIRVLIGGPLEPGLEAQLRRYWDVQPADIPAGDYGWGYVKLQPLFGPPGERFLVLDSDTVLAGPVLDAWAGCPAPFLVDDEAQSEAQTKRLYYNWERLQEFDPTAAPPQFVFNSGQWFGTAGILTREDFSPWIEWSMPPRLRHPDHFMPGDQGVLNYILNKAAREGVQVERRKIMRWPGHGMDGLSSQAVQDRTAPPLVVHWAGMKKLRQSQMVGGELLRFFEHVYYARLRGGQSRRRLAAARHALSGWLRPRYARIRRTLQRPSPRGSGRRGADGTLAA